MLSDVGGVHDAFAWEEEEEEEQMLVVAMLAVVVGMGMKLLEVVVEGV